MGHANIDPLRRLATIIRGQLQQAYRTSRRWLGVGVRVGWAVVCSILAAFFNAIDQARASPYVAIASVAAIIYTGYAALQWRAIRGQVRVMRDQVELIKAELRPDIELTNVGQPIFQLKGPNDMGQVQWDYEFQNVGKGIADKSSNVRYMKIGNAPYKLSYGMTISAVQQTSMGINEKSKGTVYSQLIPKAIFDEMKSLDRMLGIVIKFSYMDDFGTPFSDTRCIERLRTGDLENINPGECKAE